MPRQARYLTQIMHPHRPLKYEPLLALLQAYQEQLLLPLASHEHLFLSLPEALLPLLLQLRITFAQQIREL